MKISRRTQVFLRLGMPMWISLAIVIACDSPPSARLSALASPSDVDASIRSDVETLSRFAAEKFEGISDPEIFYDSLESLVNTVEIPSGMDESIESFKGIVYHQWGISFDPDQDDIQALLPHTIFSRRSGSCLGVSLIFLMLAEETQTPLRGVVLPGHFFVRYSDSDRTRNIEPNRGGYAHPDNYYRQRYAVSDSSGYYLRDLTKREVVGVLCYNLGNIFREKGRLAEAQALYRAAVERFDEYAEAWGNLAIVLNSRGHNERAWAAMAEAYRRNRELPGILKNRAALALSTKRYEEAVALYDESLSRKAEDPEVLLGLVYAYMGINDMRRAYSALRRLKGIHPDYPVPSELGRNLEKGK